MFPNNEKRNDFLAAGKTGDENIKLEGNEQNF